MNAVDTEREALFKYWKEMTIQARIKEWHIFQPDWEYLSGFPTFTLASIVGQSIGLHPYFASPSWVFNRAIPYFEGERDFDVEPPLNAADAERCKQLKKFLRRIHIAVGNLAPLGDLLPVDGVILSEATWVKAADFLAFAIAQGWDLPDELLRNAYVMQADPETRISKNTVKVNAQRNEVATKWMNKNKPNLDAMKHTEILKELDSFNSTLKAEDGSQIYKKGLFIGSAGKDWLNRDHSVIPKKNQRA